MCLPDLTPPGRLPCDKILLEGYFVTEYIWKIFLGGNFVTFLENYFPKATESDKTFLLQT